MIKNRSELLSHGFVEGREKALEIAEYALRYVDPCAAVKKFVKLEGSRLVVGEDDFDLDSVNKIFAIGAGKATYPLAVALEEILGDRITDGFVAVKKGQKDPFGETLATDLLPLKRDRKIHLAKHLVRYQEFGLPNQPTLFRMIPVSRPAKKYGGLHKKSGRGT
jgi:hypothetical protein